MIVALLAAVQVATADSVPRITLEEALQRAARLDPTYIGSLADVDNAEWGRRAALTAFLIPTVTLASDIVRASDPVFNFGTGTPLTKSSSASRSKSSPTRPPIVTSRRRRRRWAIC